tara:strand:- start:234 stop:524 length:291 start_codon:yes stop_codon:yes gene_type:complete
MKIFDDESGIDKLTINGMTLHDDEDDMVNHPPHYNKYGVECIDALRAATGEGFEYYLQGNVIKYMWRYRYKNGIEDLKKANWYLELMIAEKQDNES